MAQTCHTRRQAPDPRHRRNHRDSIGKRVALCVNIPANDDSMAPDGLCRIPQSAAFGISNHNALHAEEPVHHGAGARIAHGDSNNYAYRARYEFMASSDVECFQHQPRNWFVVGSARSLVSRNDLLLLLLNHRRMSRASTVNHAHIICSQTLAMDASRRHRCAGDL